MLATFSCYGQVKYIHNISIAAITKDDHPYIAEWIDYHRLIGADHFYIYDNNEGEETHEILAPYIREGIVDYVKWPTLAEWGVTQNGAYTHALKSCKGVTKWLSFLDTDEFIVPMKYETLTETLEEEYAYKPLIFVNWRFFGTSFISLPPPCLILPHLTRCSQHDFCDNKIGKMIVQPEYLSTIYVPNPHLIPGLVPFSDGSGNPYPFNSHQEIWATANTYPVNDALLRINHYSFRDEWFFRNVKIPRVIYFGRPPEREYQMNNEFYNMEEDDRILTIIGGSE